MTSIHFQGMTHIVGTTDKVNQRMDELYQAKKSSLKLQHRDADKDTWNNSKYEAVNGVTTYRLEDRGINRDVAEGILLTGKNARRFVKKYYGINIPNPKPSPFRRLMNQLYSLRISKTEKESMKAHFAQSNGSPEAVVEAYKKAESLFPKQVKALSHQKEFFEKFDQFMRKYIADKDAGKKHLDYYEQESGKQISGRLCGLSPKVHEERYDVITEPVQTHYLKEGEPDKAMRFPFTGW